MRKHEMQTAINQLCPPQPVLSFLEELGQRLPTQWRDPPPPEVIGQRHFPAQTKVTRVRFRRANNSDDVMTLLEVGAAG